ncbi:hypothetical protein WR25_12083 [Diploscapter pachys]|uniref:Uncharacterized protein n=1 Tax=Diploscapter pachys TaxID=2018661 RepID=A0A2A2K0M7_9BILA|nr:hypothetical protein WR25_12083 [Diploscapter pachys]
MGRTVLLEGRRPKAAMRRRETGFSLSWLTWTRLRASADSERTGATAAVGQFEGMQLLEGQGREGRIGKLVKDVHFVARVLLSSSSTHILRDLSSVVRGDSLENELDVARGRAPSQARNRVLQ